jgi:hypothetical protein
MSLLDYFKAELEVDGNGIFAGLLGADQRCQDVAFGSGFDLPPGVSQFTNTSRPLRCFGGTNDFFSADFLTEIGFEQF